jgi:hypothetical protein
VKRLLILICACSTAVLLWSPANAAAQRGGGQGGGGRQQQQGRTACADQNQQAFHEDPPETGASSISNGSACQRSLISGFKPRGRQSSPEHSVACRCHPGAILSSHACHDSEVADGVKWFERERIRRPAPTDATPPDLQREEPGLRIRQRLHMLAAHVTRTTCVVTAASAAHPVDAVFLCVVRRGAQLLSTRPEPTAPDRRR